MPREIEVKDLIVILMTCIGTLFCIMAYLLKCWIKWKDACSRMIKAILKWGCIFDWLEKFRSY